MKENTNKLLKRLEESLNMIRDKNYESLSEIKDEINDLFDLAINENKVNEKILDNCSCFGIIHKVFEHNAPNLFKSNNGKKIIGKYIKTIKDDDILKEEFSFYSQIMSCPDKGAKMSVIDDALSIKKNYPKSKISESNEKLFNIIKENELDTNVEIDDNLIKVLKSIETLYETKKTIKNLGKIAESKYVVCSYDTKVAGKEENENINIDDIVSESISSLNKKYESQLSEDEKSIIKTICSSDNLSEKEELFNECKNNIIDSISKIINEGTVSDEVNKKLKILKEKVEIKEFNEKTLMNDMIELYDISNILE